MHKGKFHFVIISPWKKTGSFIWTNLNPLHPRMHCAKFGWNWPRGYGEDFKISSMYFHYFVNISPWERTGPFIWINVNSHHSRMLCAKFGWNWISSSGEEDFFNFVNGFLLFRNYLPLEKGAGPFIWTNVNSLHPLMHCAKFGWIWPSGPGEDENVKSLDKQIDGQTKDDKWSEKLTWVFSSGELKSQI